MNVPSFSCDLAVGQKESWSVRPERKSEAKTHLDPECCTKSSWSPVTRGVIPGVNTEVKYCWTSLLMTWTMGQTAPSASLQVI